MSSEREGRWKEEGGRSASELALDRLEVQDRNWTYPTRSRVQLQSRIHRSSQLKARKREREEEREREGISSRREGRGTRWLSSYHRDLGCARVDGETWRGIVGQLAVFMRAKRRKISHFRKIEGVVGARREGGKLARTSFEKRP